MDRRRFFQIVSASLLAASLAADAQQAKRVHTIGYLSSLSFSPVSSLGWREAFEQALQDLGWTKGQTVAMEYRSAEGQLERPGLASELVNLKVDLIFAPSALERRMRPSCDHEHTDCFCHPRQRCRP